jgi:putative oxidoreductase
MKSLFATDNSLTPTIVRIVLGAVLFPHGAQKVFGWFGGAGFEGTMGFFTGTLGIPAFLVVMVMIIECVGSILLMLGLLTRVWAMAIFGLFVGIILKVHIANGFFMNWMGKQAGEGYEYHLLVLGMALALVVAGGGRYALDHSLSK